jgi:hypothetical protein
MSVPSTGLSAAERKTVSNRLLYSRRQVAELLGGITVATVRQLEREGRLTPIRLTGRKTGQVFFTDENVRALIKSAAEESVTSS